MKNKEVRFLNVIVAFLLFLVIYLSVVSYNYWKEAEDWKKDYMEMRVLYHVTLYYDCDKSKISEVEKEIPFAFIHELDLTDSQTELLIKNIHYITEE